MPIATRRALSAASSSGGMAVPRDFKARSTACSLQWLAPGRTRRLPQSRARQIVRLSSFNRPLSLSSHPSQQLRLLRLELGVGEDPCVA
jgi:hypothetical protein